MRREPARRASLLGLLAILGLCHCGAGDRGPSAARAPEAAGASSIPERGWRYEVTVGPLARELVVEAALAPGSAEVLGVDAGAEVYVRDLMIAEGGVWQTAGIEPQGSSWVVPACASRGCRLRYRFLLGDASVLDDVDVAFERNGVIVAGPATWLLRPLRASAGSPYRFRVHAPPEVTFVTGVQPAADGAPGTYQADVTDLALAPHAAFGPLRVRRLSVGGARVDLAILPGELALDDGAVAAWVQASGDAVAGYYGRFPVSNALVLALPSSGRGVHGTAYGNGGAAILLRVGERAGARAVERDWVLTHEMVHLGFPSLVRRHSWLEEGIATYVEPIARARMGALRPEEVWFDLVVGLPQGQPEAGDRGLDNTPSWGRTYWGGALFCMLADLEIRKRTNNERSLDDALRGILAAGGSIAVRWGIGRALAEGDRATGVPVLRELHERMGSSPAGVDLAPIWQDLGITRRDRRVELDDAAPLAAIRRAITEPRAAAAVLAQVPARSSHIEN
jgi:hypothetical protein